MDRKEKAITLSGILLLTLITCAALLPGASLSLNSIISHVEPVPIEAEAAEVSSVSTPDEYVSAAGDASVSNMQLIANLNMTGKGFVDLSNKTLDLNGYAISADNFTFGVKGDNVVVENGDFVASNNGSYALFIGDAPASNNVLVKNCTLTGGINVFNSHDVVLQNVNVTGVTYYAVWCDANAEVTVESGDFSSEGYNVLALTTGDKDQSMTINGGTYTVAAKQGLVNLQGGKAALPTVNGGNFNTAEVTNYVAKDKAILANDNTYAVLEPNEAKNQANAYYDGIYYVQVAEAEQAASIGASAGKHETVAQVKVTYTGEDIATTTEYHQEDSTIPEPVTPVRAGYDFEGWYTNDNTKWDFTVDKVKAPLTLIGEWQRVNAPNSMHEGTADHDATVPSSTSKSTSEALAAETESVASEPADSNELSDAVIDETVVAEEVISQDETNPYPEWLPWVLLVVLAIFTTWMVYASHKGAKKQMSK